jgi:hypothetical protein
MRLSNLSAYEKTMAKKKSKPNPHCPVAGCRTKAPHASDQTVSNCIKVFEDPKGMTVLVRTGLSQLLVSIIQDWNGKRTFAWFCRIRQTEELFYKTLYALFFASVKELHHMVSGEPPNSIVPYYTKVNDELYAGRGQLTEKLPGLPANSVLNTPLEMLHSGAHTAFSALISGYAFATNEKLQPYAEKLHWKITMDVDRIDWVHRLFLKGLTKQEVLSKYKNDRHWQNELAEIREGPKSQYCTPA